MIHPSSKGSREDQAASGTPRRYRRGFVAAAGIACVALAASACGSSSSKSSAASPSPASTAAPATSGSSGGSSSASLLPTANPATAAAEGAAAGKQLGTAKLPQGKTIAYLRYIASDTSDQLDYQAFTAAAGALGWKVVQCDGQGNPTVMLSCGHTLLAEHPDAFVDDGIPPSLIAPVLQQAASEHIPTVSFSGTVSPCAPYSACYAAPDAQMGSLLAKWVAQKLSPLPAGQQQMIVQTFPSDWGNARVNAIAPALAGTQVKVVAKPTADATNLVAGTQQQVTDLTSQYPNAKAVWITFDGAASGAAQAVATKYAGSHFPNAPMVVTFYQEPETLQLIKKGEIAATVYESLGWNAFVTVDQLAEYFARNTPLSSASRPVYPGGNLQFWQPRIIDSSNVGSGAYPASPVDYPAYFAAKWKAEFGVNDTSLATALNPIP